MRGELSPPRVVRLSRSEGLSEAKDVVTETPIDCLEGAAGQSNHVFEMHHPSR